MRYLLLINQDEAQFEALDDAARAAMMKRYADYGKKMIDAGICRTGAILRPTRAATTVRMRGGKPLVTDGPFAETAEQIAGFAIIDVPDLDAAIAWAKGHPDAEWGSVEVRPLAIEP